MAPIFNFKSGARKLAETTGHSYQKCLGALRAENLDPLVPNPADAHPTTVVDVAGAALFAAGARSTPGDARRSLLEGTVRAVVHRHHPDAVSAVVQLDEQEPHVGLLAEVEFANGVELDGPLGEPVGNEAFLWADLLAAELGLRPGEGHELRLAGRTSDEPPAGPPATDPTPHPPASLCRNCGEPVVDRAASPTNWTHRRDRIDWCNPDLTTGNAHTLAEPT